MRFPGTPVHVDEVWRNCDPRDEIVVRVTSVSDTRVEVVDAATGKRPRSLLRKSFHDSANTTTGAVRRTGYVKDTTGYLPVTITAEDRIRHAMKLIRDAQDTKSVDVGKLLDTLSAALTSSNT